MIGPARAAPAGPVPRRARRRDRRRQVALGAAVVRARRRSSPRTRCARSSGPASATSGRAATRSRCSTSSSPSGCRAGSRRWSTRRGSRPSAARAGARWPSATACRPTRCSSRPRPPRSAARNRARAAPGAGEASSPRSCAPRPRRAAQLAGEGFAGVHRAGPVELVPPAFLTAPAAAARQRGGPHDARLRPADRALRVPRASRDHGGDARGDGAGGRGGGLHEPVGDGPLPPDPAGRPRVGGHAREHDDARPTSRASRSASGSARSSPASPTATSRTSRRSSPRSTCCRAGARCAASGTGWFEREHVLYGWAVPAAARALRAPGGRARAAAADVGPGLAALRGPHGHGRGGRLLPAAAAGAHPDPRRRLGRAAHPAARRAPRRRVQPVRRSRHRAPQGRGAARALRRRGPRPGGRSQ